jgi:hypothetical protein
MSPRKRSLVVAGAAVDQVDEDEICVHAYGFDDVLWVLDCRDDLSGGRVDDIESPGAARVNPGAVDVDLLGFHDHPSSRVRSTA